MGKKSTTVWVWWNKSGPYIRISTMIPHNEYYPDEKKYRWHTAHPLMASEPEWEAFFNTPLPPHNGARYECLLKDLIAGNVVWRRKDA